MLITLRNDFHDTSCRLRLNAELLRDGTSIVRLTNEQDGRARRLLCGMSDCTCGGIRGPQTLPDGTRFYIEL